MGTRSLLAVETKPGKYHVQYMQFDGEPATKGQEYYGAIMGSLQHCPTHFVPHSRTRLKGVGVGKVPVIEKKIDWTKPHKNFFTRIKHFLDNYQYQSGHSIGSHWICSADEWEKQDCNQEWQYLFDKEGNFTFFPVYDSCKYYCTIPWEFTINLARLISRNFGTPNFMEPFWDFMSRWNGETFPLRLSLDMGEAHAFPDHGSSPSFRAGDGGWRDYGVLHYGKKVLGKPSTFSDPVLPRRNERSIKVQYKSEYLSVMAAPKENLPLHINVQRPDAKALLAKRLHTA